MKVWIVEFGEYSSRYVSAVYSTEENAKIAAGAHGEVSEFEIDPAISLHRSGLSPFRVEMSKNGEVLKTENLGYWVEENPQYRINFRYPLGVRPAVLHLTGTLWAKTEEQAVKATNEHRGQVIASGEWEAREVEMMAMDARYAKISQ